MNEAEWLECGSPEPMLAHLGAAASPRKKRLFAVACVRRVWPLLTDRRLRQAARLAERFADGRATAEQLAHALRAVVRPLREELQEKERRKSTWKRRALLAAAQAVEALVLPEGPLLERPRDVRDPPDVVTATRTARTAFRAIEAGREVRLGETADPPPRGIRPLHTLDAAELVREVFGNPFRPAAVDPAWLTANDGVVPRLARACYDDRRFTNLPILADALEEVGCADAALLGHCRAAVEHVRGCWVIDALLGKE